MDVTKLHQKFSEYSRHKKWITESYLKISRRYWPSLHVIPYYDLQSNGDVVESGRSKAATRCFFECWNAPPVTLLKEVMPNIDSIA